MIIVTGAAGFIGSVVSSYLQQQGSTDLVLVDDFTRSEKAANWKGFANVERVERSVFADWLAQLETPPEAIIHLGARTDTSEQDWDLFLRLNLDYTKMVWTYCADHGVPLVYASSAATYGGGEQGFDDDHNGLEALAPLNPYGRSKHEFDRWALAQEKQPPFWAGLKFFNVYGPNEYHKGRMASVFFHAFNQIQANGHLKLFSSHREDIAHGEQSRDFIYVMDIAQVITWLLEERPDNGLYNLGSGVARTFLDLGKSVFSALGLEPDIRFIDTPVDIRDSYQYYTCANMQKLVQAGYSQPFTTIEAGANEYVRQFLLENVIF
ncbi:UNVERIFIED_CONTAM: hypothetical protein GTU68_031014 [Idotea baltica]|nr:hypothetical protein [Idotea baltica]